MVNSMEKNSKWVDSKDYKAESYKYFNYLRQTVQYDKIMAASLEYNSIAM